MKTLFLAALLLATPAVAAPAAVPATAAAYPADLMPLAIASHGSVMNGRIYLAAGKGPHPTLLLLHGFPGVEQNGDIAQAVRRAGWNVVLFHYRGAWGSPGDFSFGHAIEDTQAVLDWMRDPANAAGYRIDPKRIVVAGHSMGGFVTVETVAHNPGLAGAILIDAWNPGADAARIAAVPAQYAAQARSGAEAAVAVNLPPLHGTSAPALLDEIAANAAQWNTVADAKALAAQPLLLFGATAGSGPSTGIGADNAVLLKAVEGVPGARVTSYFWPTDHYLSDKRVALADDIIKFLNGLSK
jgi:pimeloyl-ACP methyl ester carboxylesterase